MAPDPNGSPWRKEPPTLDEVKRVGFWWLHFDGEDPIVVEAWPTEWDPGVYRVACNVEGMEERADKLTGCEWAPCVPPAAVAAPPEHGTIDERLREIAHTDEIVHAALQAHRHGLSLIQALTAAVVQLAQWRRAWSPEVMKATMMQPPAPIVMQVSGEEIDRVRAALRATTPAPPAIVEAAREALRLDEERRSDDDATSLNANCRMADRAVALARYLTGTDAPTPDPAPVRVEGVVDYVDDAIVSIKVGVWSALDDDKGFTVTREQMPTATKGQRVLVEVRPLPATAKEGT